MTESQFDAFALAVVPPVSRRRVFCLAGSALLAGLAVSGESASAQTHPGEVKIVAVTRESCGGCTSGNGLKCFGLNACTDKNGKSQCVKEQVRDCCGKLVSEQTCCPNCPEESCKPNIPCSFGQPGGTTVSDTCPPEPGVSPDCQYYARMDKCTGGKCKYFKTGIKQCASPPPTLVGRSKETLRCIRQCLQVADVNLPTSARTGNGCSKRDSVTAYHNACFESCGVSEKLFPDNWWWFVPEDGN